LKERKRKKTGKCYPQEIHVVKQGEMPFHPSSAGFYARHCCPYREGSCCHGGRETRRARAVDT